MTTTYNRRKDRRTNNYLDNGPVNSTGAKYYQIKREAKYREKK